MQSRKYSHLFYGIVTLALPELEDFVNNQEDPEFFVEVVDSNGEEGRARVRTLTPLPPETEIPESHRSLNTLSDEIVEMNMAKGFGSPDEDVNLDQALLMIVGELVEAQDELRDGHACDEVYYNEPKLPNSLVAEVGVEQAKIIMQRENEGKLQKPEGFPVELADVLIRTLHLMGRLDLDIDAIVRDKMNYNATRAYRHGKAF